MTAFQKVVAALQDGHHVDFRDGYMTRESAVAVARAVLMAVRGVDGHGIEIQWWSERVVDAVLKEGSQ